MTPWMCFFSGASCIMLFSIKGVFPLYDRAGLGLSHFVNYYFWQPTSTKIFN